MLLSVTLILFILKLYIFIFYFIFMFFFLFVFVLFFCLFCFVFVFFNLHSAIMAPVARAPPTTLPAPDFCRWQRAQCLHLTQVQRHRLQPFSQHILILDYWDNFSCSFFFCFRCLAFVCAPLGFLLRLFVFRMSLSSGSLGLLYTSFYKKRYESVWRHTQDTTCTGLWVFRNLG